MTDHTEALTKQLLSTLPHYTPNHSWTQVYKAAKAKGEIDDYARFLANEHIRLNGLSHDTSDRN